MSESKENKVLITGAAGMLGSQLLLAVPDGVEALGTDLREAPGVEALGVDLTDPDQVSQLFRERGPFSGVIHAAAYTAVDKAEEEPELAERINGLACGILAGATAQAGIPLVIVSTDFVFDGEASVPYEPRHPTNPLSVYGRTKLSGEQQAFEAHPEGTRIVRTQWLYGPRGKHFPGTILGLLEERDSVRVVSDQIGSPTSTLELAPALWDVLLKGSAGIWHATCEGEGSWYDFACATVEFVGIDDREVQPCSTEEFLRPAHRPPYSVLDCERLTALRGAPMAHWRDALKTFLGS
jgi:dTDP-4-dehydrorhamnose reductase